MAGKRKFLRRILYLLCIIWLVLLVIAFFYSRNFESTIISLAKRGIDKHLQAEIIFHRNDVHFSLFRKFPSASLQINNLVVLSPEGSSKFPDTLLIANKLSTKLNLLNLLNNHIVINEIELHEAEFKLFSVNDELKNYDIWKKTTTDDDSSSFEIKNFKLTDSWVNYTNLSQKIYTKIKVDKGIAKGNFHREGFELQLSLNTYIKHFKSEKNYFLRNQYANAQFALKRENELLKFINGGIQLSGLPAKFSGWYNTSNISAFNFKIKADKINLQKVKNKNLSRLYKQLEIKPTRGFLSIDASVHRYTKKEKIGVNTKFGLNKVKGNYLKTGTQVDNFYAKGSFSNGKYRSAQTSMVKIDSMHIVSDQTDLHIRAKLQNLSKPSVIITSRGILGGNTIADFLPDSSNAQFEGTVQVGLKSSGILSFNAKTFITDFVKLNHDGFIKVENSLLNSTQKRFESLKLNGTIQIKEGNSCELQQFTVWSKHSNFSVSGELLNWRHFLLKDYFTPVFNVNIKGNELNQYDFMPPGQRQSASFTLPKKIRFETNIKLNKLVFSNFEWINVKGKLSYRPFQLKYQNLSFNSFNGKITGNGSIQQAGNNLLVISDLKPVNVSINRLFNDFNNFNQTNLTSDNIKGSLTGSIHLSMIFDNKLKIQYPKLKVISSLQLTGGELINYKPLEALSKYIELDELKHVKFSELTTDIFIENNMLQIDKTNIYSSVADFSVNGIHEFNNDFTYHFQVALSDLLWKKARKKRTQTEFGHLLDDGIKRAAIPLVLTGNGKNIDVKYDKQESRARFRQSLKEERDEWKNILENEQSETNDNIQLNFEGEEVVSTHQETVENELENGNNKDTAVNMEQSEFLIEWED